MDRKLDFAIIGVQKAGTTSFFNYVGQHPQVYMPRFKEMQFFVFDEEYARGESALDPYFKDIGQQPLVGFAHVHMIYFPEVARRLHQRNPDMKILAVLRNPIDRAWSAYWFARERGTEKLPFEETMALEDQRATGTYQEQSQLTYLRHGHYAEQLQAYADVFGKDRLFVVLNDDLSKNPEPIVRDAIAWLGADPTQGAFDFERHNVASWPRFQRLNRILADESLPIKRIIRRVVPTGPRLVFRSYVTDRLIQWNLKPWKYPKMEPETRDKLRAYFAPHNARLGEFLERDLGHWK